MSERLHGLELARSVFYERCIDPVAKNPLVAQAFRAVDRRSFAPLTYKSMAYTDRIIPLADGSTLSQPSLMATMLDLLELTGTENVLEVGTASGYTAALLSRCAERVHTIEYDAKLARKAAVKLHHRGYNNVSVHHGDGARGVPSQAPFDRILITAAVREIPQHLFDQLADGGIVVAPVGETDESLRTSVGRKMGNTLHVQKGGRVEFVLLNTIEHGGWTDEARAKKRSYTLLESEDLFDIPRPFDERRKATNDQLPQEPTEACLNVLESYGLTQDTFISMFVAIGQPEEATRRLLSLHPEPFEDIVNALIWTQQRRQTTETAL